MKIESTLVSKQRKIAKNILLDLGWVGFGINRLQFGDDLLNSAFAVAAFNDFEAWAAESQCAFRHEERAGLLRFFIQAAAGSETRVRLQVGCHAVAAPFEAGRSSAAPLQVTTASFLVVIGALLSERRRRGAASLD